MRHLRPTILVYSLAMVCGSNEGRRIAPARSAMSMRIDFCTALCRMHAGDNCHDGMSLNGECQGLFRNVKGNIWVADEPEGG